MKIRLMIVDDDVQIREGIRLGIDWESIGVAEAKSYADGIGALADFGHFRPQIILADIRMPGMDGLEFLRHIQERDSSVKVVLISAYSDFEYCQKAIRYGAAGYELKPLKVGRLIQTIQEMVKAVREEEEGKEAYERYVETYKEKMTEELLAGRVTDRNVILGILKRYFGLEGAGNLICMAAEADWPAEEAELQQLEQAFHAVSGENMALFRHGREFVVLAKTVNSALYILETQNRLKGIVRKLMGEIKPAGTVSAGISGLVGPEEIAKGYRQARKQLDLRFSRGPSWTGISGMDGLAQTGEKLYIPECWQTALETRDREKIAAAVDVMMEYLRSASGSESEEVFEFLMEALGQLLQVTGKKDGIWIREAREEIRGCLFLEEYLELWQRQCLKAIDAYEEEQGRKYSANIRRALSYIRRHYAEDISAEQVAGQIGKTPNYFSSIFKKEVGMAFREYLNRCRAEEARKMIETSDLLIYEIAERVGYKDYAYFSQVFKKITGESPTSLRGRKEETPEEQKPDKS